MEENSPHIDYDTHWKEITANLFEDFVAFFLPEAYDLIDFTLGIEFLEQELHKIVADNSRKGKIINDKLVKVHLKSGEEKWILIHIEVQSTDEANFSKRMFSYFYRIFDQYSQEITAIAVYIGEKIPENSSQYTYDFLGTKISYEFNTYVVKDQKESDLVKLSNPFALAILATKYLHKSKSDSLERFSFKRKLIKLAKTKGYKNHQIIHLLKFINLILQLPENLENQFAEETLKEYLNPNPENMAYLKSRAFSNQIHIALYGESIEEFKAKLEEKKIESIAKVEEKRLSDKLEAIQNILRSGKLSTAEIAKAFNVSEDFVLEVKSKME